MTKRAPKRETITAEELRRSLGEIIRRVAYSGEPITVTYQGKPAVRIEPVKDGGK